METDRIPCGVIEEPDDPLAAPARRVAWVARQLAALLPVALTIYALADWQGQALRAAAYEAGVAAAEAAGLAMVFTGQRHFRH